MMINTSYSAYIQQNRDLALAQGAGVFTEDDLASIESPQLLLSISTSHVINALANRIFSCDDIKSTFAGFKQIFSQLAGVNEIPEDYIDAWVMNEAEKLMMKILSQKCVQELTNHRLTFTQLSEMSIDELNQSDFL